MLYFSSKTTFLMWGGGALDTMTQHEDTFLTNVFLSNVVPVKPLTSDLITAPEAELVC